ncbi:unnamed protein product [Allacma fusca]|uniref:C2H2-type domain-containing protein n=1 Tax=Allacma fusca TaxID=39272 RepID=A0A8J2KCN5_9HEXA|nr:unnamed protein product [Allacma fusca]
MCNNFVELHEHRLNSHPVDEPFQCHICRLVLTSAGTYHSHMQLHEIQAVDCEFCSEKFPNNSELERHIIACHRFKRVRIEKAHLQGSNLQPTVSLQPVLNFQSAHKLQEKANIQSNTLKAKIKSLKRIAPKEVATRNSRYSFSVAKQRILFKCVSCSEVFHTAAALGEHRLTLHPHEDTYKCHICGKIVSRANSLNDHVRRHTGLRPYRCKICSNSFKTAGDARQHHFAVHGNNGDKQQANKIMAASNVLGSTLVQDLDDRELEADDNEEDEDETNFVNFPSASLIEVSLSDTGSDSFNMEEVELFD